MFYSTKLLAFAAVLGLVTPAFPQYTLSYDIIYDQKEGSLTSVACSTGENGLMAYGYNTFDELPTYPFIGGAPQIQSWNSPACGTCWELTYIDKFGVSGSLTFTAINTGSPQGGFTISSEGMNAITQGNAATLDGASITAVQEPAASCGLIPVKRVYGQPWYALNFYHVLIVVMKVEQELQFNTDSTFLSFFRKMYYDLGSGPSVEGGGELGRVEVTGSPHDCSRQPMRASLA